MQRSLPNVVKIITATTFVVLQMVLLKPSYALADWCEFMIDKNVAASGCVSGPNSSSAMAPAIAADNAPSACAGYCESLISYGFHCSMSTTPPNASYLNSSGSFANSHSEIELDSEHVNPTTVEVEEDDECPTEPVDPKPNDGEVQWCSVTEIHCVCACNCCEEVTRDIGGEILESPSYP